MIVRRFFEPQLAQASYLIGCTSSGEAIVIDPHRDADTLHRAPPPGQSDGSRTSPKHISTPTILSGSRELATRSGATLLLSDEGDADWKYALRQRTRPLIRDGDRIDVGNVAIDVVHTPGHTPEHLTFFITDGAVADAPIAAATGDFVFVGDVGRPDLLETRRKPQGHDGGGRADAVSEPARVQPPRRVAADLARAMAPARRAARASARSRTARWATSAASTGRSRRAERRGLCRQACSPGQPDPPKYFATMKRLNRRGPRVIGALRMPKRQQDEALASIAASGALVVDTRPASEYAPVSCAARSTSH